MQPEVKEALPNGLLSGLGTLIAILATCKPLKTWSTNCYGFSSSNIPVSNTSNSEPLEIPGREQVEFFHHPSERPGK